jgi:hypothetical protein
MTNAIHIILNKTRNTFVISILNIKSPVVGCCENDNETPGPLQSQKFSNTSENIKFSGRNLFHGITNTSIVMYVITVELTKLVPNKTGNTRTL